MYIWYVVHLTILTLSNLSGLLILLGNNYFPNNNYNVADESDVFFQSYKQLVLYILIIWQPVKEWQPTRK